MSEPGPWTPDDPEWLEVARIELGLERARDDTRPAEERVDACIEFFAWTDREFPGWSDAGNRCIAGDVEITGLTVRYATATGIDRDRWKDWKMQTKARPTGRPSKWPGESRVFLAEADHAYVRRLAEREERPVSQVLRQLVREAIAARESQPRKGSGKRAA